MEDLQTSTATTRSSVQDPEHNGNESRMTSNASNLPKENIVSDSGISAADLQLRRVAGKIPWTAYTIAFVELCERFSYYGTTVVCKSNTKSGNLLVRSFNMAKSVAGCSQHRGKVTFV